MNKHKLNIFPEMSSEDFERLRDDIVKNGYDVNYPIWFYEGQILDGWNRERACNELHIEPVYAEFTGSTIDAIEFVMRSNKRRNLTSSQWACIAVEAEDIITVIRDEARERKLSTLKQNVADTELIQERSKKESAEITAELFNTNSKYIYEAQKLKDERPEVFEQVKAGLKTITEVKNKPHVSNNSGENEWYTPEYIIEAARKIMGSIDLDPASSKIANQKVKARKYFDIINNGLEQKWHGNIWLNPPYGQPLISQFSEKINTEISNFTQACILTNNATETEWYQNILINANAVCFLKSRVKFIDINGNAANSPLQGQSIIYIGKNSKEFYNEFKQYGICLKRMI